MRTIELVGCLGSSKVREALDSRSVLSCRLDRRQRRLSDWVLTWLPAFLSFNIEGPPVPGRSFDGDVTEATPPHSGRNL